MDRIKILNEEQRLKNKIQALSGIDDIYLDTICDTCKSRTTRNDEYLHMLNEIIINLLNGWSISYISHLIQGNKYTSYKGEENIMSTKFELPRGNWVPLVFEPKFVEVVDVNPIVPNKVIEVTFADGTKEKSVCREPDTFSMESAISICISKKIMGGSSAYNKSVKRGMKVYEKKLEFEKHHKEEQERIEKKRAKRLAYKERRAAKRREEQIAIQTEAYLRAMDTLRSEGRGV